MNNAIGSDIQGQKENVERFLSDDSKRLVKTKNQPLVIKKVIHDA